MEYRHKIGSKIFNEKFEIAPGIVCTFISDMFEDHDDKMEGYLEILFDYELSHIRIGDGSEHKFIHDGKVYKISFEACEMSLTDMYVIYNIKKVKDNKSQKNIVKPPSLFVSYIMLVIIFLFLVIPFVI